MQRFYDKVSVLDNGCWMWLGGRSSGYGKFQFMGKLRPAHVVSYILHCDEVPEGTYVLHTCDNKWCVNPKHLFLGSQQDNMTDKVIKDRQAKGQNNGNSKLSEDEVIQILRLCEQESSNIALGELFNVSEKTIYNIRHRLQWRYLDA